MFLISHLQILITLVQFGFILNQQFLLKRLNQHYRYYYVTIYHKQFGSEIL